MDRGKVSRLERLRGDDLEETLERLIGDMMNDLLEDAPTALRTLHAMLTFVGSAEPRRLCHVVLGSAPLVAESER